MKRLNLRLLLIILLCGLMLAAGIHFLHAWQVGRHAGFFLDRARLAKKEGKLADAVAGYNRYLSLVPGDAQAMAEAGLLQADMGWDKPAYANLESVLRREPGRPDAQDLRRKLVDVSMRLKRYKDAMDHLNRYLLPKDPQSSELLDLLGQCQQATEAYEEAAKSYKKALQRRPSRLDTYARLAGLLLGKPPGLTLDGWNDEEKKPSYWLDEMVRANAQNAAAYLVRGDVRRGEGADSKEPKEAIDAFSGALDDARKAIQLAPKNPGAYWLAAQCCLGRAGAHGKQDLEKEKRDALVQAEYANAQRYAEDGLKVNSGDPRFYLILSGIEQTRGRPDGAITWLKKGVAAIPGNALLLESLAAVLIDKGAAEEARAVVDELAKADYPRPLAQYFQARVEYFRARIDVLEERWLAAAKRFDGLHAEVRNEPRLDAQAYFWQAYCYEQLDDTQKQFGALRQAVQADPLWMPARGSLAAALASQGNLDEAIDEQERIALGKDAPPGSAPQWIRWMIVRQFRLPPEQRDWARVETVLDDAQKKDPGSLALLILRAELLIGQGRAAEAESLLAKARDAQPKETAPWIALVEMADRREDWAKADQLLNDARQALGDIVPLRLARASHLVRQRPADAAQQLGRLAEGADSFPPPAQVQLWRGLALASLQVGDLARARALCARALALRPNDFTLRVQMFELAARQNDAPAMQQALDQIERMEGQGAVWHYAQAMRLLVSRKKADAASLQEALKHLDASQALRAGWSRVPYLKAAIYDLEGNRPSALRELLAAVELGDREPITVRRALELLFQQRRYADADKLIARLEQEQVPFSTEITRLKSAVAGQLGDFGTALPAARQVAAKSQNYGDHLWLGQVLSVLGQRDEAEKALRHSIELNAQAPEAWVTLVRLLARSGRSKDAEEATAQAQAKIPAEQAPWALAECYDAIGKPDEAGKQYEAALGKSPNDPDMVRRAVDYYIRIGKLQEAQAQLRRIVAGKVQATAEELIDARRRLAVILSAGRGYPSLVEAIGLVDENLAADAKSVPDLRLMAVLLASHPQRARREEAIRILENQVLPSPDAAPGDRLLLARLLLAAGRWPQARKQMVSLVATHGDQPGYVATYVGMLLDHQELQEAQVWLSHLEKIAPDDLTTAGLRAEAFFQRKDLDQAIAALHAALEKPGLEAPQRDRAALAVAAIDETFAGRAGRSGAPDDAARWAQEAETLYRRYVAEHPGEEMRLAGFLARQGRLDESLDAAQKALPGASLPAVFDTLSALVAARGATPEQTARVEKLLLDALAKYDRPVPLLLTLADLRVRQERFADVEAVYREVLKRDGQNLAALNNLAELLALQDSHNTEALKLIDDAVRLSGPIPTMLDTRATVYLRQGKPQQALADLKQVIAEEPRANRYFHLALAYYQSGQKKAAADAMKQAESMKLSAEQLHPLERPLYERLAAELKQGA